jgi:hypothetical protein
MLAYLASGSIEARTRLLKQSSEPFQRRLSRLCRSHFLAARKKVLEHVLLGLGPEVARRALTRSLDSSATIATGSVSPSPGLVSATSPVWNRSAGPPTANVPARLMSNDHLLLFSTWFAVYVAMWLFVLQRLPLLTAP